MVVDVALEFLQHQWLASASSNADHSVNRVVGVNCYLASIFKRIFLPGYLDSRIHLTFKCPTCSFETLDISGHADIVLSQNDGQECEWNNSNHNPVVDDARKNQAPNYVEQQLKQ